MLLPALLWCGMRLFCARQRSPTARAHSANHSAVVQRSLVRFCACAGCLVCVSASQIGCSWCDKGFKGTPCVALIQSLARLPLIHVPGVCLRSAMASEMMYGACSNASVLAACKCSTLMACVPADPADVAWCIAYMAALRGWRARV